MTSKGQTGFYLTVTGQVESCAVRGGDNLHCKYNLVHGTSWNIIHGLPFGISQVARKGDGKDAQIVSWNYPIEITYRSSNVHGWPQIVVNVLGLNMWGQIVIRGYGVVHIPLQPGKHELYVRMYRPVHSTWFGQFRAWLLDSPPEFDDPHLTPHGRIGDVIRVKTNGIIKIVLNVATRNMEEWGYDVGGETKPKDEREREEDAKRAAEHIASPHVGRLLSSMGLADRHYPAPAPRRTLADPPLQSYSESVRPLRAAEGKGDGKGGEQKRPASDVGSAGAAAIAQASMRRRLAGRESMDYDGVSRAQPLAAASSRFGDERGGGGGGEAPFPQRTQSDFARSGEFRRQDDDRDAHPGDRGFGAGAAGSTGGGFVIAGESRIGGGGGGQRPASEQPSRWPQQQQQQQQWDEPQRRGGERDRDRDWRDASSGRGDGGAGLGLGMDARSGGGGGGGGGGAGARAGADAQADWRR